MYFQRHHSGDLLGLKDRFLPHVGDAMELFDDAWSTTSRVTVMKCWMKSQCLPEQHMETCMNEIIDIRGQPHSSNLSEITIEEPISEYEASNIQNDLNAAQLLDIPKTPLSEILDEAESYNNAVSVMTMLNSPAPFDNAPSRQEVADSSLQKLFTSYMSADVTSTRQDELSHSTELNIDDTCINKPKSAMDEVQSGCEDPILHQAMKDFMSRVNELRDPIRGPMED